ncbi:hypothetical protein RCL1_006672 [Eukaryota sp. TZLM3-RCL]
MSSTSNTQATIGTAVFMSPEVVAMMYNNVGSDYHYSTATDLWSLGVLLYLLVEKKLPFNTPQQIESSPIPKLSSEFGSLISNLLVRDPNRRLTANQLIQIPQIVDAKNTFDRLAKCPSETLPLNYELWCLRSDDVRQLSAVAQQSKWIGTLESERRKQCEEISSLHTALTSKSREIGEQNKIIDVQKSTIRQLQARVTKLEVKLERALSSYSDQASVVEQLRALLPYVPQLLATGVQRKEVDDRLAQQRIAAERLRTKFLAQTKGSSLVLSTNDCHVESLSDSSQNSFVAINHPTSGQISLSLRCTRGDGSFSTYIGYFDHSHAQSPHCISHFTAINPYWNDTKFITSGGEEYLTIPKLKTGDCILVLFENTSVTFSSSHSKWQKIIHCDSRKQFGIVLYHKGESWSLDLA